MRLNKFLIGLEEFDILHGCSRWVSICIFAVIYLTSSFMVTNDLVPSFVVIGSWLFLCAYLCSRKSGKDISGVPIGLTLCALFIVSYVVNDENIINGASLLFSFFVAILFCVKVPFRTFKDAFVYIMTFLAWVSMICYILYSLIPQMDALFTITRTDGTVFSNIFLYVSDTQEALKRNQGIFWEPGAYQAFIGVALIFELFSERVSFKRVALFVVTIISTLSTTGYIATIISFLIYYFKSIRSKDGSSASIFGITLLSVAFIVFLYQTSSNVSNPLMKVFNFYDNQGWADNTDLNSASVRYFSIVMPLKAFWERPLFGYGYEGLINYTKLYTDGMNTCTMINWFALYGVFFGTLMIRAYFRISKIFSNDGLVRILLFVFLFTVTMSENFAANAFFFMIAIYGSMKIKQVGQ